mmetsp:Transcript_36510/g.98845  ORF Transcript_36510/g.98845 Transcript_36510/m.98845 type:complete len:281 (+) Transcript_36510:1222-2064(+)
MARCHRPRLEKGRGAALGCRDRAKGLERGIAVEDRDGLRNGGVLVCPQLGALLVLLCLLGADGQQLVQEGLGLAFLPLRIGQQALLRPEIVVVGAQGPLLGLVEVVHVSVRLVHGVRELVVGVEGRLLGGLSVLEVGLEGVPHVLQDADHLARLRRVGAGEGRLEEGLNGRGLLLPDDCGGGEQGLPHGLLQVQQCRRLVVCHELLVVGGGLCHRLVGTNVGQHLDGVVHPAESIGEVGFEGDEVRVLFVPGCRGLATSLHVCFHVRLQLRNLCAQDGGV